MSKIRLGFDHSNVIVKDDRLLDNLARQGFLIYPHKKIHFGCLESSFILFSAGDLFSRRAKYQYLEISKVTNAKLYRELFQADGIYRPSANQLYRPGISLKVDADLRDFFNMTKKRFSRYGPELSKLPYRDRPSRGKEPLGWTLYHFAKDPVKQASCWITENDSVHQNKPKGDKYVNHPNTASKIRGFLWRAAGSESIHFMKALGARSKGNILSLDDGLNFYGLRGSNSLTLISRKKKTQLTAVLLECSSLREYLRLSPKSKPVQICGTSAAHLRTGPWAWDLLVFEIGTKVNL